MTIDQRFSNMNKQINELTGLVLASTDKLSSNIGEGNNQNTASDKTCARSNSFRVHPLDDKKTPTNRFVFNQIWSLKNFQDLQLTNVIALSNVFKKKHTRKAAEKHEQRARKRG